MLERITSLTVGLAVTLAYIVLAVLLTIALSSIYWSVAS